MNVRGFEPALAASEINLEVAELVTLPCIQGSVSLVEEAAKTGT